MRQRPQRLAHVAGIGVDQMGALADAEGADFLRLENLDVDIPPDARAIERTRRAITEDDANSYLPFIGRLSLRRAAARHVSKLSGVAYSGEGNCIITAGGLSGILNVLLATVDVGDEVILTDPTYAGLINRVRLAGGVPKFAPFVFTPAAEWRLDREKLRASIGERTRALLLMSPSMPSGGCLDREDWSLIAEICVAHDLLLILDAAMERLLFGAREVIHPAGFPGMAERCVTVGSCAKELRMIGWRVGWIVAPESLMPDLVTVSLANVVVPVGLAQEAAVVALERSYTTLPTYVGELERRRDTLLEALRGLPVGVPAGGWSLLMRVRDFGIDGAEMSRRLLERKVAATAMAGWGDRHAGDYIRFVFSNEPVERLKGLGAKLRDALNEGSSTA